MYEKKSIKILTGGLNTLLPADSIDDSESQELKNWSVDSYGALRSRRGHALLYSVGGRPVAMTRALGSIWVAAGGSVYKDGAAIVSGVSSDRVGLVGFRSFIWIMSAAAQRKSDGASDWRWLPEAPTIKATTAPAAEVATPVVDLTGGFTVDPAGDERYNPTLEIKGTESEYTAEKDIALDLFTGFSLDDIFKIRVWAKKWPKINRIVFQIDVNDGTFTKDYYTAEMKQADIQGGAKEEVTIYLRKRPRDVDVSVKDKKRYGWFERIGATPEKDYRSCVKVRLKISFVEAVTRVRFEEWSLVGDIDAQIEGDDIRHYYTFQTDAGHESNPAPVSDPVTVNRGAVDLSAMQVSADPQVTKKNVYRTGGTLGHVYLVKVNTTTNGATTYTDNNSDDTLTNLRTILENDHDDPPQVGGLIGPFYGRLVAFGGSKFYWSHTLRPYSFSGPDLLDGDWNSVEEGVGELLAATMVPGILFLYGTNNLVVVQGDPGSDSAVHASAVKQGIRSPNGVCQTPRGDIANLSQGIYAVSGDSAQLLSKKIENVFKRDGFNPETAAIGYLNDVIWVSDGTLTYKLDLERGFWVQDSREFSCFYNDEGTLLGATPDGDVIALESGFNDAGASFSVAYTSKSYDCGILDHDKLWDDFTIWHDTGGATLTVVAILNDGESTVALGTISSASKERSVLRFGAGGEGVFARNCAIRITGSVSSECVIFDMALNYIPQAREGKSYNTDKFDCGTFKPKIFRELKLDIENDSIATIKLKTDVPNFTMSSKDTSGSVVVGTERRMEAYVFPAEYIGRLGQLIIEGESLQLFRLWVLHQVIGTYLSGARDEYWLSDVLDFDSEKVKLAREIEIVYSTTGSATLAVETELPGATLAVRETFSLGPTDGEETRKLRLHNNVKGRLWRFRLTPNDDSEVRVEAIRINIKQVGFPNATGWGFVGLPVAPTQDAEWSQIALPPDSLS